MPINTYNREPKIPILKECPICKIEYNTRTGAYDNKYGFICIDCYQEKLLEVNEK